MEGGGGLKLPPPPPPGPGTPKKPRPNRVKVILLHEIVMQKIDKKLMFFFSPNKYFYAVELTKMERTRAFW